jgi:hypothetical protein
MEISMEVPQKNKNGATAWNLLFLGLYPKESKSAYNRDTCTPMFIATLFTVAKLLSACVPINR